MSEAASPRTVDTDMQSPHVDTDMQSPHFCVRRGHAWLFVGADLEVGLLVLAASLVCVRVLDGASVSPGLSTVSEKSRIPALPEEMPGQRQTSCFLGGYSKTMSNKTYGIDSN